MTEEQIEAKYLRKLEDKYLRHMPKTCRPFLDTVQLQELKQFYSDHKEALREDNINQFLLACSSFLDKWDMDHDYTRYETFLKDSSNLSIPLNIPYF